MQSVNPLTTKGSAASGLVLGLDGGCAATWLTVKRIVLVAYDVREVQTIAGGEGF